MGDQMSYRTLVLYAVYFLPLVSLASAWWSGLRVTAFLKSHASIGSQLELEDFKSVAKTDMYLALTTIAIFGSIVILIAFGFLRGDVEWADLIVLLVYGPLLTVAGVVLTNKQNELRSIPVHDEDLREEFEHVVKRWKRSALPDW